MSRIQHIAIFARQNVELAEFYKSAFGMEEVFRQPAGPSGERTAVYLTDGHINLALLPSGPNGKEGIDHFGFKVDATQEAADGAVAAGAKKGATAVPRDGRFAEVFVLDPVGTRIDLSESGWATTLIDEATAAARIRDDRIS